jgi:hypothetical protein
MTMAGKETTAARAANPCGAMFRGDLGRRSFCRALAAGATGLWTAGISRRLLGEEVRDGVLYPAPAPAPTTPAPVFSWHAAVLERIPPLRHARGSRWPLIAWEGFSTAPEEPDFYRQLLDRGLAQHIRLDSRQIETALAIQRAGSPVIVLEGASGAFPADLAGEPEAWQHQLDAGYRPRERVRPCPSIHTGWAKFAERLRDTLRQFRDRGVRIDAVWTDWENDPLYGADRYEQARRCKRCRELVPRKALASNERFLEFTTQKFYDLFGAYYAAPVLEFYPKCSVTNWLAQPSTPEEPQPGWSGNRGHVQMPPLVTAWNPTAYGAASWVWKDRSREDRRDQDHVDQVYMNLLLRQVSLAGSLGERWAPEKELIPWVARWVSEPPEREFPVMSRARYREALRHHWLRGVAGMQVFSPRQKGYEDMALLEVEDAVAVYDEMLEFREFLEGGEVLTHEVPPPQDDGVVWSGLRLGDRAVARLFRQSPGAGTKMLRPWGDREFSLEAPKEGATYLLKEDGQVKLMG